MNFARRQAAKRRLCDSMTPGGQKKNQEQKIKRLGGGARKQREIQPGPSVELKRKKRQTCILLRLGARSQGELENAKGLMDGIRP